MIEVKIIPQSWHCKSCYIFDANGDPVADTICGKRFGESESNARLIAAAPDLYELLRQTEERFDIDKGIDEDEYIYRQEVRAALAKARGE